jgi:hypothetical protein
MLWSFFMKINDEILQKVSLYEEKHGIVYAKTDGSLYKTLKGLYVLAFCYTMVMNFLFVIGNVMSEMRFEIFKNTVYMVLTLSAGLILSLVIIGFKKYCWAHIAGFLLNLASCAGLTVVYARQLEDVIGYKTSFYWRHFVPFCLMVLLNLVITVIAVRAILKFNKNCKTVIENTSCESDDTCESIVEV